MTTIQTITQKDAPLDAKLNTYDLHFRACTLGALGVASFHLVRVHAENMEKAELALYQEFSHISIVRCLSGLNSEGELLPPEELKTSFDSLCVNVFQDLIDDGETPESAHAIIRGRNYQMVN